MAVWRVIVLGLIATGGCAPIDPEYCDPRAGGLVQYVRCAPRYDERTRVLERRRDAMLDEVVDENRRADEMQATIRARRAELDELRREIATTSRSIADLDADLQMVGDEIQLGHEQAAVLRSRLEEAAFDFARVAESVRQAVAPTNGPRAAGESTPCRPPSKTVVEHALELAGDIVPGLLINMLPIRSSLKAMLTALDVLRQCVQHFN